MRIWSIANQKGGVGKTTSVVALGGLLAERGARVLLIDLDPHGSLTSYFRYDPDSLDTSLYDLFFNQRCKDLDYIHKVVRPTSRKGVDLSAACHSDTN